MGLKKTEVCERGGGRDQKRNGVCAQRKLETSRGKPGGAATGMGWVLDHPAPTRLTHGRASQGADFWVKRWAQPLHWAECMSCERGWRWMLVLLVAAGCTSNPDPSHSEAAAASVTAVDVVSPGATSAARELGEINPRLLRRFKPLRPVLAKEAPPRALVDLGRMLYFDPRLSASHQVSCNSCHPLDRYGATPESVSVGVHGNKGTRNAPTTFNAAGHFTQFWDGRAPDVEEQAKGPIANPLEMGMQPETVVALLESIPGYRTAFASAFPNDAMPITWNHVGQAIGAFERGLTTPSRWDAYLLGDLGALNQEEKDGAKLFINLDCLTCHTGELLGALTYEKVGRIEPWPNQSDVGRATHTKSSTDEMMFKVPSLRNVAKTAPYFHDGSAATLVEAVEMMARYQLGEDVTPGEAKQIATFLAALTGTPEPQYIAPPTLPPSGPTTPAAVRVKR